MSGIPRGSSFIVILVEEAKKKGVKHISLEATDMGRLLYKRYGFVSMKNEMELPEDCL